MANKPYGIGKHMLENMTQMELTRLYNSGMMPMPMTETGVYDMDTLNKIYDKIRFGYYTKDADNAANPHSYSLVKRGRWEEVRNAYGELEGWLCECGREVKCKERFCPSCGAWMQED